MSRNDLEVTGESEVDRLRRELARRDRELAKAAQQLPRLRQLVEFSTDMMFLLDREGFILDCNRGATEQLGHPRDGLFGREIAELTDAAPTILETMRGLKDEQTACVTCELTTAHGERLTAEVNLAAFWTAPGRQFVAVARDITERTRLAARSMQADRMMAVGILASGVAHEINNPLAYILANVDWACSRLASGEGSADDIREALMDARHGIERVSHIVADLNLLSRGGDQTETADLSDAVHSALQMAQNQLRHRAELRVVLPEQLRVAGDQTRLAQVFLNLLVNAAQAIPEGHASENQISVIGEQQGDWLEVRVSDTGEGIPPDVLDRIFEPFFTTKEPGLGTGLGLAICREAVVSAGGSLSVESTSGDGTTFIVRLPVATAEAAPPIAAPALECQRLRVLVIDDEPRLCMAIQRMLSPFHDVTTTTDGREALAWVDAGEAFDALLCDIMMPEVDGRAVFQHLSAHHPALARATSFMTGGVLSGSARDFQLEMGDRCLAKPFELEDLLQLLGRTSRPASWTLFPSERHNQSMS